MDIPVIVRCVPPAVPPLDGVTDWILTMWIRMLRKFLIFISPLRLLCNTLKLVKPLF